MKKTLKKGGISTRRTNVSSRGRRVTRNIPSTPPIRRQRRNISRGNTDVLCDDTSAARRNIRTRYPRSRRNARSQIPPESSNVSPSSNVLSGIPNLREARASREILEVRRPMVRRNLYPEGSFQRMYGVFNAIIRRLNSVMNNEVFNTLSIFLSSQFIINFANSIYRFLPQTDDIIITNQIIQSIASGLIMFLLRRTIRFIRLGRPREIINLLYYYVMVERKLRLEEIEIESIKEQITEQEYLERMGVLRNKYLEWEELIGRRDSGMEDLPNLNEMIEFEDELHVSHTEDIHEPPPANTTVNQGNLGDVLSQYNTTDTNVALQRAMGDQDRNSIRIILESRE